MKNLTKNFIYLVCCCLQEAFNGRNWSESQHCIQRLQQDETECLDIFETQQSRINYIDSKYSLDLEDEFESMDTTPSLSEGQNNTVEYISGYIVRKLRILLIVRHVLDMF